MGFGRKAFEPSVREMVRLVSRETRSRTAGDVYESFDTNVTGIVGHGVPNAGLPMKRMSVAEFGSRKVRLIMACSGPRAAF
jgi:hypothetical protein